MWVIREGNIIADIELKFSEFDPLSLRFEFLGSQDIHSKVNKVKLIKSREKTVASFSSSSSSSRWLRLCMRYQWAEIPSYASP